jgi:hypothetical protein
MSEFIMFADRMHESPICYPLESLPSSQIARVQDSVIPKRTNSRSSNAGAVLWSVECQITLLFGDIQHSPQCLVLQQWQLVTWLRG